MISMKKEEGERKKIVVVGRNAIAINRMLQKVEVMINGLEEGCYRLLDFGFFLPNEQAVEWFCPIEPT
jgi:hypothetical protein